VGAVDEGLCEIELSSFLQVLGEAAQQPFEHAFSHPALEAPVAG
jgi:hypothetical protein